MLTGRPLSTISYNTEAFLVGKLDYLYRSHIISCYACVYHKGEYSAYTDCTEKDHWHVYFEPSKRLDTEALRDEFIEVSFTDDKPLGCMPLRASSLDDWLLYGLHDERYLSLKGLERQFHYSLSDVRSCDDEWLVRAYDVACEHVFGTVKKRRQALEMGVNNAFLCGLVNSGEYFALRDVERNSGYRQMRADSQKQIILEQAELIKELQAQLGQGFSDRDSDDVPFE